jgi:hypothetical protein
MMAGQSRAYAAEPPSPADRSVVEVKFLEAAEVRGSATSGLSASEQRWLEEVQGLIRKTSATSVEPLVEGISQDRASRLSDKATEVSGSSTPDMSSWYRFRLPLGADAGEALALLRSSPVVSSASRAPEAVKAPSTPDFSASQLYLGPAPVGTNTEWVRDNEPRARGAGIRVVDLEYYWTASHEDLQLPATADLGGGTFVQYPNFDDEHGTAVFGIMAARDNGFGVTGGVPEVTMSGISPVESDTSYNPSGALTFVASKVRRGDVVLIEQQIPGPNGELVPLEWQQSSFDAIRNLSNLGVVVVETGGNGGQDLDNPIFSGRFDRSVRDSDAIIVGAGDSVTRSPLFFTSRGSRMDLQGYGDSVVTTGGSNSLLQGSGPGERNIRYTSGFSGTSSAGPVVANAVVAIQSYLKAAGAGVMTADQIADVLKQTGTPQGSPGSGQIGPLPDIPAALFAVEADPPVVEVQRAGTLISLSADDGWGWGVASLEYRLNGGQWTAYTEPVDVSGVFEFEYRASDLKGNVGEPALIQVTPRPVTRVRLRVKGPAKAKAGRKMVLTATMKNTGAASIDALAIKTNVPGRVALRPRTVRVFNLGPDSSAKRKLRITVRRKAAPGTKLRIKVTVSTSGKTLASRSKVIRITR